VQEVGVKLHVCNIGAQKMYIICVITVSAVTCWTTFFTPCNIT